MINKIDMWVAKNPFKYHLYTKTPLMKNHFNKVEESNKKVVGIKVTKDSNEIELILSEV